MKFENYYDGIKVNSAQELVEALKLVDNGTYVYLVEEYDDEERLTNPISLKEHKQIQNILIHIKSQLRHRKWVMQEGGWIINSDRFLLIKKEKQ